MEQLGTEEIAHAGSHQPGMKNDTTGLARTLWLVLLPFSVNGRTSPGISRHGEKRPSSLPHPT